MLLIYAAGKGHLPAYITCYSPVHMCTLYTPNNTVFSRCVSSHRDTALLLTLSSPNPNPTPHKTPTMATPLPKERRAWRRTDDHKPGAARLQLVTEPIPALGPLSVLIAVHAVSLNYRDANISNGGNPWPVTPQGIICNDAAGSVIAVGSNVKRFQVGDRVAPTTDTAYLNHRSTGRSWLAANEDGVAATHIVYDEGVLARLPNYLPWESASLIPCAGVTAWAALRGVGIGGSVLIQGKFDR